MNGERCLESTLRIFCFILLMIVTGIAFAPEYYYGILVVELELAIVTGHDGLCQQSVCISVLLVIFSSQAFCLIPESELQ